MENGKAKYSLVGKGKLLVRKVDDEVIIYDHRTQKAHCLNGVATSVWEHWEAGKCVPEICFALDQRDEDVVWAILLELEGSGLLTNRIAPAVNQNVLSRRDLIKRMGLGMAVPIITSVVVPPPAAAASPTTHPRKLRRTT